MEFRAKLKRLTEQKNKSQLARAAGLSTTAISDYIQKGYIPRADKAVSLARALAVPTDWLYDDERDWPPPPLGDSADAGALSDVQLMKEVARRYRLRAVAVHQSLKEAEAVDWLSVAREMLSIPLGNPLPPKLQRIERLVEFLGGEPFGLGEFDGSFAAEMYGNQMPGHEIPSQELRRDEILERVKHLRHEVQGFSTVNGYLTLRFSAKSFPRKNAGIDAMREDLLRELPPPEGQHRQFKSRKS